MNKKVYVLVDNLDFACGPKAVFSSEEAAQKFADAAGEESLGLPKLVIWPENGVEYYE